MAPPGILKYPTAGYVSDMMAPPPNNALTHPPVFGILAKAINFE